MVTVSQLFLFEYNDFINNIKLIIIIIYIIKYIYYMSVFYFK